MLTNLNFSTESVLFVGTQSKVNISHLKSKALQALEVDIVLCVLRRNTGYRAGTHLLLQSEVAPGVGLEGRDDPHLALSLVEFIPLLVLLLIVALHELELIGEAPVQDLSPSDLASLGGVRGCRHHVQADSGGELPQPIPNLLTPLCMRNEIESFFLKDYHYSYYPDKI